MQLGFGLREVTTSRTSYTTAPVGLRKSLWGLGLGAPGGVLGLAVECGSRTFRKCGRGSPRVLWDAGGRCPVRIY